jgi:UDP-glucuronate 4-epimerase
MKENIKEKILVTGCAGFIGMHLCKSLLNDGFEVCGIDNMNSYYDKSLKNDRIKILKVFSNFFFEKVDLNNLEAIKIIFENFKPNKVVNLAAQAGVQYSLINPSTYIKSNVSGFLNILECCKDYKVRGLIYASSSSVYGSNKKVPFSELDNVDNPISIYAATKKSNELMASVYNHLYNLNSTGLRFFTVYGEWGRPDMAYYSFTEKILKNEQIEVYNYGKVERDFTYIDDIVTGIKASIEKNFSYEIFNLGNSKKEKVLDLIKVIENKLDKKAKIVLKPLKSGDVTSTNADITKSSKMLGYNPKTNIDTGLGKFIKWYLDYA